MNEDFGMGLNVGDRLPDFRLEDQNGDQRPPESVRGRWLVFFTQRRHPGMHGRSAVFKATWMCFRH